MTFRDTNILTISLKFAYNCKFLLFGTKLWLFIGLRSLFKLRTGGAMEEVGVALRARVSCSIILILLEKL